MKIGNSIQCCIKFKRQHSLMSFFKLNNLKLRTKFCVIFFVDLIYDAIHHSITIIKQKFQFIFQKKKNLNKLKNNIFPRMSISSSKIPRIVYMLCVIVKSSVNARWWYDEEAFSRKMRDYETEYIHFVMFQFI